MVTLLLFTIIFYHSTLQIVANQGSSYNENRLYFTSSPSFLKNRVKRQVDKHHVDEHHQVSTIPYDAVHQFLWKFIP